MLMAMWGLKISGLDILGVPALGAVHCLGGMACSYMLARALQLPRPSAGAFIVAGGWSNTWLIGGYLSFFLLGRQGFALASLYNVLNAPLFYIGGFSIAKLFSPLHQSVSTKGAIKGFFTDPVSVLPNLGLLAGLGLNLAGATPGPWFDPVSAYLVPALSVGSMFAVGMSMTFRRTREYTRPILAQALVKYLVWPAITLVFVLILRGNLLYDPTTFRVLALLSVMPVAMQSMVLSNLFDLDIDLVNAAWLVTNVFSLITSPILVYLVRLL